MTDAQSPWQNGPTERAGGVFKELFDKMLDDFTSNSQDEYLEAAQVLVAQRNARADKSGFSPDQRVFCRGLRLPGHLLADDKVDPDLLGA